VRYYLKEKDQVTSFKNMKVADLNLSLPEVIALYFLKGHARLYQGTEIETEINRAFAKLDTFVPDGFERRLEKVKTLFSPSSQFTKDYTGKEKIIDDLTEAMLQQKTCHIEYHSFGDDKLKNFKIDPLRFFERNGGLYAFMRSTSFGDIRILAVERIQSISVLDSTFDYPKDFDPDALLDNALGFSTTIPSPSKSDFPLNRHDISRRALGERPEVHQIKERIDHTYHENVRLVRCETLGSFLRSRRGIAGTRRDA